MKHISPIPIRAFLLKEKENLMAYALLFLIGFSALAPALSFVPANGDDLILLSSVANTPNPIKFFFGDWGLGNNAYRPLHSLTLWLSYQFFGVSAGYNQLLNLILHFANICLLFRLIHRVQSDVVISFLLTSLSLFSIYTISPAIWVSDRPSLFVALFFLILLNYLYKNDQPSLKRISYIVILSVLACMSKESGLIVPLFALYWAIHTKQPTNYRAKVVIITIVILAIYIALRLAIFGSHANSYSESGYIWGIIRYDDWSALPKHIQYYAYLENVIKNLIAPFIPVFNGEGGLFISSLVQKSPLWLFTVVLVILTITRKLSALQKAALVIILLNSVVHYSVFRYRTQYLSQLAVCIFIASSPMLINSAFNRKFVVKVLATVLLAYGIFWVSNTLQANWISRYEMLNEKNLLPIVQQYSSRIDDRIVVQILQRYKR